jgi:hypothetical protein
MKGAVMRHRPFLTVLATCALVAAGVLPARASVGSTVTTPCAQPNGRVAAMVASGRTLYLGGSFTSVRNRAGVLQPRAHLAAVDADTCELLPWRADTDADVYALEASGGVVYAGGAFTHVGGAARARLAALDATATVLPFDGALDKPVRALDALDGSLYAGGDFLKAQGAARSRLAAYDLGSGALRGDWKPAANGSVLTIERRPDGAAVYVGGNFTTVSGSSQPYLSLLGAVDGSVDPGFAPWAQYAQPPFPMIDLVADSRGLYGGGGGSGGHLVVWNLDGTLQRPVYQTDGGVQAVAVDGDSLYVGGHFTNYCVGNTGSGSPYICTTPLSRRKAFEVRLSTGELTGWAPRFNSPHGVLSTVVDPVTHGLWTGGDFTKVGAKAVDHLAYFKP